MAVYNSVDIKELRVKVAKLEKQLSNITEDIHDCMEDGDYSVLKKHL